LQPLVDSFAGSFFWFLLFWACLGGFVVGLSLFWLEMAATGRLLLTGDFQSNCYYKVPGIRVDCKGA